MIRLALWGWNRTGPGQTIEQSLREIIGLAQSADRYGFDSIMASHHLSLGSTVSFPPLLLASRLAAETSRLRLNCALLLPLMHPVDAAEQLAMLDQISSGRLLVGVIGGWRPEEFTALGIPLRERGKRMDESLEIITRLWAGEEVTFHGRCFELDRVRLELLPVQKPRPPLLIGANASPVAVRRAARRGDSWFLSAHPTIAEQEALLNHYREELARVGKPFPPPDFTILRQCFIAETREEAWDQAQPELEAYNIRMGGWGLFEQVLKNGKRYLTEQELVEDRVVIGTPDDVVRQIKDIQRRLGVTTVGLSFRGRTETERHRSFELIARHVLPAFQTAPGLA